MNVEVTTIPIDACICEGKVTKPRRNCWATTHDLKPDPHASIEIEFWSWDKIPADRKREWATDAGMDREVLGTTFKGEPAWLPWMGQS